MVLSACVPSPTKRDTAEFSTFEQEVLADGVVTRSEIEAARAKTIECLAAAGFVAEFEREDDRVSNLSVNSGPPRAGETDAQLEQRFTEGTDRCSDQYLTPIDKAWLRGTAPSAEEVRVAYRLLQTCIDPYGVVLAGDPPLGLKPLIERLNKMSADPDYTELNECYKTYSLATATAGP